MGFTTLPKFKQNTSKYVIFLTIITLFLLYLRFLIYRILTFKNFCPCGMVAALEVILLLSDSVSYLINSGFIFTKM
ncbi:hypothetical protein Flavo103_10520 [Flavobacterium collinsii]|nr:hypothetical protein Flavo103_10520 [Flavobacterium collinsii]